MERRKRVLRNVSILVLHGVLGHHRVLLHGIVLRVDWSLTLHGPVLHGVALVSHAHAALLHRHTLRLAHVDIWHLCTNYSVKFQENSFVILRGEITTTNDILPVLAHSSSGSAA